METLEFGNDGYDFLLLDEFDGILDQILGLVKDKNHVEDTVLMTKVKKTQVLFNLFY